MDTKTTKNKNKKRTIVLSMITALLIMGVMAFLTDTFSFTNTFTMANENQQVNIAAQEKMLNSEGTTVDYVDPVNVMAGDLISKIPQVAQKGSENQAVWIRARVTLSTPSTEVGKTQLTAASIVGASEDWTLNTAETVTDEANHTVTLYYYKNNGLNTGETTMNTLFTGVQIPSDWGNESAGTTPTVEVTFEAIQKAHVTQGTLTEADPWGGAAPAAFETVD